jgi:solute carrier family 45 protein 1/2/4
MVTTGIAKRPVSIENDPIRQQMLKQREEHARRQSQDYSHVFRRRSRIDLIRLSCLIMGIEFAYAAETAFVSPILLSIGLEHQHMTMVWGLSPCIAFFVSPILGSISDRCRCPIGRRRPILMILSVGLLVGLLLAPYGKTLGALLGDTNDYNNITIQISNISSIEQNKYSYDVDTPQEPSSSPSYGWSVIFTVIGTILLDFNADNCQTPSRAYLLDMCIQEDQGRGLSTFSIMAGIGGCFGYALGGINWDNTIFTEIFGDNIKTVFALVALIFMVSSICTLTSFREIPLNLLESDEMLRPLTTTTVKKEKERLKESSMYTVKDISNSLATATGNALSGNGTLISNAKDINIMVEAKNGIVTKSNGKVSCDANHNGVITVDSDEESDEDDDDNRVSLKQYLKSIVCMPTSIRLLCLTNLMCWMSHLCYCLYFTDFVGEAVFHGDPTAPMDSPEFLLYDEGIRFGCWGMAVYALTCAIYSTVIERLIKIFKAKSVFVGGLLIFGIGMGLLGLFPTKVGVIVFSTTSGIVYATIFTIPFLLVANYHGKGSFKVGKGVNIETKHERGLGTDIAIVGSMLFIAQITISLSIGWFINLLNTTSAVLYAASGFSILAAICANFCVYMDL